MINPLRDYFERRRIRSSLHERGPEDAGRARVDHRATFRRAPGEEWTFDGSAVLINGIDVAQFLDAETGDVSLWCGLVDGLAEYRHWAFEQVAPQRAHLAHVIGGLQEQALLLVRRVYDEKIGGLSFTWGDGQCLLNNINVRAMLAMYHVRPTQKARRFLEGLRNKLALILCGQTSSPHIARVQVVVRDLYHEVCSSLAIPAVDGLCLPAGDRDLPR